MSTDSGERLVRVYNLHLDNRSAAMAPEKARWLQMRPVLMHIQLWRSAHPQGSVVLLGDFNNLEADREPAIKAVAKVLEPAAKAFQSTHVLSYHTDWIFFGGLTLIGSSVPDVVLSDHYPVVADFSLPKPPPQALKTDSGEAPD